MNISVDNSVLFSSFFFWHIFIPKHIAEAKNAHNLMANCSLSENCLIIIWVLTVVSVLNTVFCMVVLFVTV